MVMLVEKVDDSDNIRSGRENLMWWLIKAAKFIRFTLTWQNAPWLTFMKYKSHASHAFSSVLATCEWWMLGETDDKWKQGWCLKVAECSINDGVRVGR